LPEPTDIDYDEIKIIVQMGEASVFSVWDKDRKITFSTSNQMAKVEPYEIKVILEDKNVYPLRNEYAFYLTVTAKPVIAAPKSNEK
jgi:hypothetical protein